MNSRFAHLVWLGAGAANEPRNLITLAESATLFEARETACLELKKYYPEHSITVKQMVLTSDGAPVEFTEYNLPEYSAVHSVDELKILFPGIKALHKESLKSTSVTEAIEALALQGENNLLIVDIADSNLDLLKAMISKNQLDCFGEIYIQAGIKPLYTGSATAAEIATFMQEQGYLAQDAINQDPDLPWLVFKSNPLWQTLQHVQQSADAVAEELEKTKRQLTSVQQELAESKRQSEQAKLDASKQIELVKQQLAQSNKQLEEKIAENEVLRQELAQAKAQLQQKATENDLQQALEQKMRAIITEQTQVLSKEVGGLKNHINSGLSNSAKQIEAFMGIQNYLERGIKPLSFHGWPISPDIGLYITGLIDSNNYDVIIEFGSGTSTVLMAKALISKQRNFQTKLLGSSSSEKETDLLAHSINDLPARIVSFEHHSLYHGKTTQLLQENGVGHLVDLVYAPLVDYTYKDGSQYLYYNCNDKLMELSNIFAGRKANILVLVDGPPGATNKNARFPALPHLLNILPEHTFTIILDDYNRAEEKQTVELWKEAIMRRGMNHILEVIPSEKGLASLLINSDGRGLE